MELLLLIGVALTIITALSVVVDRLAEDRGRNQWAWVIASIVGLAFAFVGWLVVVAALVASGPTSTKRKSAHAHVHAHA